jgi:hypothetical protein
MMPAPGWRAHALRRVASAFFYRNKPKNITQVISANPINSVLWPQRATIPIMFHS